MAKTTARDEELSTRARIRKKLRKVLEDAEKGFEDQRQRADEILDNWDIYNCKLGPRQFYNGNSKLFVPIVRVAVNARKTRFLNQLFPQNGRHIESTSTDDDLPLETVALVEHFVRTSKLRTQSIPALLVTGDVEGQYNVYVHWDKVERYAVHRSMQPIQMGGVDVPEAGNIETIIEEKIEDETTLLEVLSDVDVLVSPATVDRIDQALEVGGLIAIVRRWTKGKIQSMIDDGDFAREAGEELLESMNKIDDQQKHLQKSIASEFGIKIEGGRKIAVGMEVWTKLKVDGEQRLCRVYYGGEKNILGCKLNPYWCDRVPLLSAPVEKMPGLFKGRSQIRPGVIDLQVQANDAINQAMDGLAYSLAPLTAVDPEKVARWENLVLNVGAVWPISPDGIKEIKFTPVTSEALQVVAAAKSQIFESLGVNPAMLPQQTGRPGSKRNQAEVALEQQVDILTTQVEVRTMEEEILTPYVQRCLDYDHQFRDKEILVSVYGTLGQRAFMQRIPPKQEHNRHVLMWCGSEAARNAAQIQQQIAFFGVLQKFPNQLYPGYRLNAIPMIAKAVENIFGASLGSQIFENVSSLYSMDPEQENAMLMQGIQVKTLPSDDDQKHMQTHMQLLQTLNPMSPEYAVTKDHLQHHQQAMQLKAMAMMQQQGQQQGNVSRGPQPGSQPKGPQQKGPPGMIHQDRMPAAGAVGMPRKM